MSFVEPLESRISPATLTGKVLTYTDADGDAVTITFKTKGPLAEGSFVFDNAFATAGPQQLRTINLSTDAAFKGTSFTMKVTAGGGDGDADIGFVNATGVDLGSVAIDGDLGRIVAGDAIAKTAPVKLLKVNSIGVLGTATQGGGSLDSVLTGRVGKIAVAGDVKDAFIKILGGVDGKLGTLTISGDLIGGVATNSGNVTTEGAVKFVHIFGKIVGGGGAMSGRLDLGGKIGKIVVDGDVQGGTNDRSGSIVGRAGAGAITIGGSVKGGPTEKSGLIEVIGKTGTLKVGGNVEGGGGVDLGGSMAFDALGKATIGGSLVGSGTVNGGGIFCGSIGSIKVVGDVIGGGGINSAQIYASGTTTIVSGIKSVVIGGSVKGGSGYLSALIGANVKLGSVKIVGNVEGGGGEGSATIFAGVSIKSVNILGSMTAGTGDESGGVESDGTLGKLTIKGNALGTVGDPLVIAARGGVKKTATKDVAIGSVSIGGNATAVNIMAGYRNILNAVADKLEALNEDAQIGSVTVKGNWTSGTIVAGVKDVSADGFGDADDAKIAADTDGILAKIGKIVIKGIAEGFIGGGRPFAFTAEQIGSVKIGLVKAVLVKGPGNDDLLVPGATAADFRIREVA